jgi:hypothetical protein
MTKVSTRREEPIRLAILPGRVMERVSEGMRRLWHPDVGRRSFGPPRTPAPGTFPLTGWSDGRHMSDGRLQDSELSSEEKTRLSETQRAATRRPRRRAWPEDLQLPCPPLA